MASEHKIDAEERRQMIAEAAYFRAERRGFNGGDSVRDWCEAEAEVDARLRQREEEELSARLEEVMLAASKKITSVRRKVARLSREARAEWQKDADKLAALRDSLQPKLVELRQQGERAGQRLRAQADKIRGEIAELLQKLETKAKH
jgi:hypothetical protein